MKSHVSNSGQSNTAFRQPLALLLSFLLPVLIMLVAFIIRGIAPFGDSELLGIDAWGQYFPMLREAEKQFFSGNYPGLFGMSWSFSGALGFDFRSQSAYYTNSPFWILLYLLPGKISAWEVDLLILLKAGLTGLSFGYFLHKSRISPPSLIPVLSIAYALSGYTLAFINQFMWMDAVLFLPLVILGIERIFDRQRPFLYLVSLTLTIWSCFYTGYMVCLFSCLWCLKCLFLKSEKRPRSFILFAAMSLLSGLFCLPVLLPLYKALQLTAASDLGFTGKIKFYQPLYDYLQRLLPFQDPSLAYHLPNICCGLLSCLFAIYFFISKRISLKSKLFFGFLFLLLFLSCSVNALDYVWHGFHFPNQLPARFSFLLIFTILYMAAHGASAFFLTASSIKTAKEEAGVNVQKNTGTLAFILAVVFFTELSANALFLLMQAPTATLKGLSPADAAVEVYEDTIVPDMKNGEFFRTDFLYRRDNAGQLYGFNGISYYSSTMSKRAYGFFVRLGQPVYAKNVSTRYEPTAELNGLFSIKYLLSTAASDDPLLSLLDHQNGYYLYENQAVMPLGFVTDPAILQISDDLTGVELQHTLMKLITGREDLYFETEELNTNLFIKEVQQLHKKGVIFTRITEEAMEGYIDAEDAGLLLFTLPEEHCSLFIDGREALTEAVLDYLLGAALPAGRHEIEIRFR